MSGGDGPRRCSVRVARTRGGDPRAVSRPTPPLQKAAEVRICGAHGGSQARTFVSCSPEFLSPTAPRADGSARLGRSGCGTPTGARKTYVPSFHARGRDRAAVVRVFSRSRYSAPLGYPRCPSERGTCFGHDADLAHPYRLPARLSSAFWSRMRAPRAAGA